MSEEASRAGAVLRTLFVVGERDGFELAVAQFDRWLAEVVRAAKYEAWQEAHGSPECEEWVVEGMCAKYHPKKLPEGRER